MKFYIITLGCKVNQYESQIMHEKLINSGYTHIDDKNLADIVVINSCTVTSVSDSKAVKLLHRVRRENPHCIIILTGCLSQAFPNDIRLGDADIILGNRNRGKLLPAIERYLLNPQRIIDVSDHSKDDAFEPMIVSTFNERTRAFVKIEDGCNRFCSYCIIPYARGRVRSKSLDSILEELTRLADSGYKEIVLVGINLSAYGQELNMDLADAIEAACSVDGIERVRLGSLEPERMDINTINRISKMDKLCPQFHLSLQSGCDETLKRMNRHYNTADYLEIVNNLRNAFDNCTITTDIMVGFPGETDLEFNQSLEFAKVVAFDKAHVFEYSRRPGTVADKAPNQVDEITKKKRSVKMIAITDETRIQSLHNQIGRVEEVLFETPHEGTFDGYTRNYTPVVVKTNEPIGGEIRRIKITNVTASKCIGELI
ncbi:MAG TPA: tRNA (N(6)-L-threonylcarbamoyladenosine(37)-C(2))-methylthiotransferase MtaB [Clostridiales bacterium]|nr:tRNA (N(6)-L-threonylcarbamoyladenosine(37)-C(2))-methylthiotransferase MtaB [Clostridiales bacterium]